MSIFAARKKTGRHLAPRKPAAPLTEIAQVVANETMQRRAAVMATAGGILISSFGAANAVPNSPETDSYDLSGVRADAELLEPGTESGLVSQNLVAEPILISDDTNLTVEALLEEGVAAVVATPAPEPEPELVPSPAPAPIQRPAVASRTNERTPAPGYGQAPGYNEYGYGAAYAGPAAYHDIAPVYATPAPAVSGVGGEIANFARSLSGIPYRLGGTSREGFDCSGFTQYVFGAFGIGLPRTSGEQRNVGTHVPRAYAQPGDLIWSPGHVAIYLGNGQMIDSPRPGRSTAVRGLWQSNPVFIRVA